MRIPQTPSSSLPNMEAAVSVTKKGQNVEKQVGEAMVRLIEGQAAGAAPAPQAPSADGIPPPGSLISVRA